MPTHYQGKPQYIQALDTYIKFTRAYNAMENRLFTRDIIEDLTPSQFGVLETLYHLGPMCQGVISGKLLKSTGNMTMVLDNLEKHGLVRRVRENTDRRMVTIHLTPAGEELIQRIFPRMVQAISEEFSVLTPDEQATLGCLSKTVGKQSRV